MRTILAVGLLGLLVTAAFASASFAVEPLADPDMEIMVDFQEYSGTWNQSTGPIVRDYLDPTVPAEAWVKSTNRHLSVLRGIYLKMEASLLSFRSDSVRDIYGPFVANYKRKLDALTGLQNAVARGDVDAETRAQAALNVAAQEGQALAKEFLAAVREYVDPADLERMLKARAEAAARALEADAQ